MPYRRPEFRLRRPSPQPAAPAARPPHRTGLLHGSGPSHGFAIAAGRG